MINGYVLGEIASQDSENFWLYFLVGIAPGLIMISWVLIKFVAFLISHAIEGAWLRRNDPFKMLNKQLIDLKHKRDLLQLQHARLNAQGCYRLDEKLNQLKRNLDTKIEEMESFTLKN